MPEVNLQARIDAWKALIEENRGMGGSDLFVNQDEMLEFLAALEKRMAIIDATDKRLQHVLDNWPYFRVDEIETAIQGVLTMQRVGFPMVPSVLPEKNG